MNRQHVQVSGNESDIVSNVAGSHSEIFRTESNSYQGISRNKFCGDEKSENCTSCGIVAK